MGRKHFQKNGENAGYQHFPALSSFVTQNDFKSHLLPKVIKTRKCTIKGLTMKMKGKTAGMQKIK